MKLSIFLIVLLSISVTRLNGHFHPKGASSPIGSSDITNPFTNLGSGLPTLSSLNRYVINFLECLATDPALLASIPQAALGGFLTTVYNNPQLVNAIPVSVFSSLSQSLSVPGVALPVALPSAPGVPTPIAAPSAVAPLPPAISAVSQTAAAITPSAGGPLAPGVSAASQTAAAITPSAGTPLVPGVSAAIQTAAAITPSAGAPLTPGVSAVSQTAAAITPSAGTPLVPGVSAASQTAAAITPSAGTPLVPGVSAASQTAAAITPPAGTSSYLPGISVSKNVSAVVSPASPLALDAPVPPLVAVDDISSVNAAAAAAASPNPTTAAGPWGSAQVLGTLGSGGSAVTSAAMLKLVRCLIFGNKGHCGNGVQRPAESDVPAVVANNNDQGTPANKPIIPITAGSNCPILVILKKPAKPLSLPAAFPPSLPAAFPPSLPAAFPPSLPAAFPPSLPAPFLPSLPALFPPKVPSIPPMEFPKFTLPAHPKLTIPQLAEMLKIALPSIAHLKPTLPTASAKFPKIDLSSFTLPEFAVAPHVPKPKPTLPVFDHDSATKLFGTVLQKLKHKIAQKLPKPCFTTQPPLIPVTPKVPC